MMTTDLRGRRRALFALVATVALPVLAAAAGDIDGQVSFGWNWLSNANRLTTDAQNVHTRLRLQSDQIGPRRWRVQLAADDRRTLTTRHATDAAGPLLTAYDDRLRLRRLGLAIDALGGRLQLGRHLPELHVIGAGDTDGATWTATRGAWRSAVAAGRRVAFWRADVGPGSGPAQWGGELGWQPSAASALAVGAWRDEAEDGRRRWRGGVNARADGASIDVSGHAEIEPGKGRLLWRLRGGWQQPGGGWRVRGDAGGQRLQLFPVVDRVDSSLYGGRSHSLGMSITRRWGRTLDVGLRLRSRYGERRQRTEVLHLRWSGPWRGAGLSLRLTDSWSRWRQLERLDLALASRWRRRWHVSAGGSASVFQWRTAREPTWRFRLRPHLALRYRPGGDWEARLRLEETVDEFQHLRTQARASLSHRW